MDDIVRFANGYKGPQTSANLCGLPAMLARRLRERRLLDDLDDLDSL